MRKTSLFRKVAISFAGRLVCRLMGEEKGAVMLEYVLLALLVATTALCSVAVFGTSIADMFLVLADTAGNNAGSVDTSFPIVNVNAEKKEIAKTHIDTINAKDLAGKSNYTVPSAS